MTIDPLAVTWLLVWAVVAAVILLAGLVAQGARRVRDRQLDRRYGAFSASCPEDFWAWEREDELKREALDDFGFDDWDERGAA